MPTIEHALNLQRWIDDLDPTEDVCVSAAFAECFVSPFAELIAGGFAVVNRDSVTIVVHVMPPDDHDDA